MLRIPFALVAIALAAPAFGQGVTLRLISGWTPNNPNVPLIEAVFIKNVADASKGEIKIQRSGPEVVPAFEQLQPVAAGVFDFLYTTPGYHAAQAGVANVFDTMKQDEAARRSSGLFEWGDDFYRKRFNQRIIAMIPAPGNHFVLREALAGDPALKGRKVRAIATFEGLVRTLGGTPVNMPPADAFSAMQKGTIDGITFPSFASADYKLYEVGKFMTRPIFGGTNSMITMNTKKFDSLSAAHQKIILDEGRKMETIGKIASYEHEKKDIETMAKNGVKEIQFDAKVAKDLNRLYNEGIVATAGKSTPAEVKALFDLARSKNMLNE